MKQIFFFFAYVTPFPSLLVSQELAETVIVDDAPPLLLKFIHLAMRIIINENLLKEKKHRKPIPEGGKGGGFLIHNYDDRYEV